MPWSPQELGYRYYLRLTGPTHWEGLRAAHQDNKYRILMYPIMVILKYIQKFFNTPPFKMWSPIILPLNGD